MTAFRLVAAALLAAVSFSACNQEKSAAESNAGPLKLRVGHFPNITHAQALVASALSRQGKGWFEERLGPGTKIEWFVYNAGPSAMEALAADSIDMTYVGPNPALNLYVKAKGEEVRIVAGSAEGGAALVVQPEGLSKPEDFRGKSIATPQLGNTQDVACRAWLKKQGYQVTQTGGDVKVLPTANPDQLALFTAGKIDGVWTVEPWVSRLELEAKGKVYLEEKDAITTVLVAGTKILGAKAEAVKKFVAAHAELTEWINKNPEEAKKLINAEIKELTKREMPTELIDKAWPRLHFTSEIKADALNSFVKDAQSAGFLKDAGDLSRLVTKP
jgi:NitT/TauT family transport system substrate-binding protein